jgi:transcriptional regulator with XRE-family HTH domain
VSIVNIFFANNIDRVSFRIYNLIACREVCILKSRIKQIRKDTGLTQSEFGEKIGVKGNTVTTYETGARVPSDAVIHSICREFNISELWLRTGEGEPHIQRDEDEEFLEVMEQIHMSDDDLIKRIIKAYWFMEDDEKAAIRKLIDGFTKK